MKGKRPTEAQARARMRNWRIRNLRGLWAQSGMLSADRAAAARWLIDLELKDAGAEPETARRNPTTT